MGCPFETPQDNIAIDSDYALEAKTVPREGSHDSRNVRLFCGDGNHQESERTCPGSGVIHW